MNRRNTKRGGGPTRELLVRDVGHGGDGIAGGEDAGGPTVMVRGGLPGERVLASIQGRRGGVARGRLLKVLQPSPERIEAPACGIADRCGGCPWMTWSLEAQRSRKLGWIVDAVGGLADDAARQGIVEPMRLVTGDADGLGYRRTARLAWHGSGQGVAMGYRAAGSRRVVDVADCPILVAQLSSAWRGLRDAVAPHLAGTGEIALSSAGQFAVAELRTQDDQPPALHAALRSLTADPARGGLAGVALRMGPSVATFGAVEHRSEAADGGELDTGDFGFVQANAVVNTRLVEAVVALAQPEGQRVLELYAGHGNLTVALAPPAARVTGVEANPAAAEAGNRNLRARGLDHARIQTGDVVERAAGPRLDVVVLDPPRTGARDALAAIVERRPQRIVYVSCDLPTLRRDLEVLSSAGYALDAATGFDMFPHTAHVETVVRLQRRGG